MGSVKPAFLSILFKGKDILASYDISKLFKDHKASFSYTDSRKKADKFTLSLDGLPYNAASTMEIAEDDEVILVFGQGTWELRRTMVIDEVGTTYADTVKMDLTGMCKSVQMTKRSGKVWKNKTDSEIATDIAKTHGFTTEGIFKTTIRRAFYAQANRTYMETLQDLAEDNGFYAKVRDNKLIFTPKGYDKAAVLTLHRADGKLPKIEAFDIKSKRSAVSSGANVQVKGTDKGSGGKADGAKDDKEAEAVLGLTYKANGNVTKQAIGTEWMPGEPYQVDFSLDPNAPEWNTQSSQNTLDQYMTLSGTSEHAAHGNADLAKKRAGAVSERILWKGVNATLKTRDVLVEATQQVNVAGAVDPKHAGTYYADEVTYSLDGLSWAVDIKLSRKPFGSKTSSKNALDKGKDKDATANQSLPDGSEKTIVYDDAGFQYTGTAASHFGVEQDVEVLQSGIDAGMSIPTGSGGMSVPL